MTDWFHDLTGFTETSYADTQARLAVEGNTLRSTANGQSYQVGTLETPSLAELRARAVAVAGTHAGRLQVSSVVGDVAALHRDPDNHGALFQVASQFNLPALPVSYTGVPPARWQAFATLVLEGAYEATLWAAVLNAQRTGAPVVFLTMLGGSAFGNDRAWIDAAMRRALHLVRGCDLDVRIVSYREADASVLRLVAEFA